MWLTSGSPRSLADQAGRVCWGWALTGRIGVSSTSSMHCGPLSFDAHVDQRRVHIRMGNLASRGVSSNLQLLAAVEGC
jgi:hypothetical protein